MARLPLPGGDSNSWGDLLNDYLRIEHNDNGTLKKAGDIAQALSDAAAAQSIANTAVSAIPTGGTTGQVLAKASNTDRDTEWASVSGSVSSVNGQSGAVVLDADDISDTSTTKKFTTAGDISKLAGIEANADVTDAANVAAAGAVMESDASTVSMSFVVDEDNMASNSATKVPTQQSTKAYVDTVASAKLDSTAALGFVDVTTGNEARPNNARVIWIGGTTEPTNMANLDVWLKEVS